MLAVPSSESLRRDTALWISIDKQKSYPSLLCLILILSHTRLISQRQSQDMSPGDDAPASTPEHSRVEGTDCVPRPKRIACMSCRRKKLKCSSQRPSCANCARLGHECTYYEQRRKSGPKRGYVKQLESRLGMKTTPRGRLSSYGICKF